MTFKPAIWHPVALALSIINFAAAGFAAASGEPWHAAIHTGLGVALGWWAERLRQRPPAASQLEEERLEALEAAVNDLRRELGEAEERIDFAERMLAQTPEMRRVDPPADQ